MRHQRQLTSGSSIAVSGSIPLISHATSTVASSQTASPILKGIDQSSIGSLQHINTGVTLGASGVIFPNVLNAAAVSSSSQSSVPRITSANPINLKNLFSSQSPQNNVLNNTYTTALHHLTNAAAAQVHHQHLQSHQQQLSAAALLEA